MKTLRLEHLLTLIVVYFEKVVVLGYRCEYRFDSEKSTSGTFQSPNFPGPYPDNVYCHYYLTGSKDERIRVSFDVFQLEDRQEAGCLFDYLEIHAVDTKDIPYFVDRLCGKKIPRPIVTDFYKLEITFRTDYVKGYAGFKARYEFLSDDWVPFPPSNAQCGPDYMTGHGGVIESPGFPFFKPEVECVWMIKVEERMRVLLAYQTLHLGRTVHCTDTAIEIYNGFASKTERPAERVCGQLDYYGKGVKEFVSTGFRIVIRYTSGKTADNETTGFKLSWTAVSEPETCQEYQCKGGRLCLDRTELICADLTRYCIDRSLKCNGVPNCGSYDKSDEEGCIGPYDHTTVILWTGIGGFVILLTIIAIVMAALVVLHQRRARRKKSEQARKLSLQLRDGSGKRANGARKNSSTSRQNSLKDGKKGQNALSRDGSLKSTKSKDDITCCPDDLRRRNSVNYETEPMCRTLNLKSKNSGAKDTYRNNVCVETALLTADDKAHFGANSHHSEPEISTRNSDPTTASFRYTDAVII